MRDDLQVLCYVSGAAVTVLSLHTAKLIKCLSDHIVLFHSVLLMGIASFQGNSIVSRQQLSSCIKVMYL